ncbi:DUF6895 family protein [Aliikangiella coralliicola]|uniref:DUF6895 domain-containing protein n=1 Tax=Aliikangiella coralliicola TaxID=2592383 RepID=A0A545UGX3_9GAMM|nr:hypothetical protein [Aliikangiella coralliicola]TQV88715.1 hypothetical protein FLL46_04070 [Aliikangiella coralliicola]
MFTKTTPFRLFSFVTLLIITISLIGYSVYFSDPYRNYRSWQFSDLINAQSVSIKPIQLNHNQNIEKRIRDALSHDLPHKEAAILSGLHWLLQFIDQDTNFNDVFSDFIILAHELSRTDIRSHQAEIAGQLLKQSLQRGQEHLDLLFPDDEEGRWDFIGLLPIIANSPEFQEPYFKFYQQQYGELPISPYRSGDMDFQQAVTNSDYEVIGDYLIDTSFLHYYLKQMSEHASNTNILRLPEDNFLMYLKSFESFDYNLDHPVESDEFSDLAYLATHVVLVLTNYGEFEISPSLNNSKVNDYIEQTYPLVRHQLSDLDLLAEYLQCLKILNNEDDKKIALAEQFLLSLQRKDGSWGTMSDFNGEPYIVFHPTWAVLTALNH